MTKQFTQCNHGKGFDSGGPCIESALSICCIVGRDLGLTHKHANAIFTATTTFSSPTSTTGGEGRLSITSFNNQWSAVTGNEDEDEEDADDNRVRNHVANRI